MDLDKWKKIMRKREPGESEIRIMKSAIRATEVKYMHVREPNAQAMVQGGNRRNDRYDKGYSAITNHNDHRNEDAMTKILENTATDS